ncbi:MAG: GNAT family N-acetyltransferase [Candidatus Sericytochromatia bacterium]|nr:GNAT family N-acetyltransferase [Candidatus Tanganyikabacteria bacterium]
MTPIVVSEASDDQRDAFLAHTHVQWGGKRSLAAYRTQVRNLLATPWGRDRYRFYLARSEGGSVVAGCKVYDLDMLAGGRVVPTIGFGAVFAVPEFRGRGHAAAMLRVLMGDRGRAGAVLATLMSDIDPGYYERLGFVRLPSTEALAPVAALPDLRPGARLRPATAADHALIATLSRDLARRHTLSYRRHPDHVAFVLAWREIPDVLILEQHGRPAGFLIGDRAGEGYLIVEGGSRDPADTPAWLGAVAARARKLGATRVCGWLPAGDPAIAACFAWHERTDGIWMAAPLTPEAPDVASLAAGAHCWEFDHF